MALLGAVTVLVSIVSVRLDLAGRLEGLVTGTSGTVADVMVIPALATAVAAIVLAVRRHRDAEEVRVELADITRRDRLTGLRDRRFLTERLEDELRATHRADAGVSLVLVDLDRFDLLADTHGHEVADAVLVAVADRLQACVTDPSDRVVRHAEDRFAVIGRDDPLRPLVTTRLAGRILTALEEPFEVGRESLRVTARTGVAVSTVEGTVDDLVRAAEAAVHDARARGDARPVVFDPAVHGRRSSPATLEPALRAAVRDRDLRLAYQPVVDVASGRVVGAEALLRWDHPERGPVPPAEFVPVLEETGLIVEVGAWVLREAIAQGHRWHTEHPGRAPIRVMINVSARQLAQTGFEDVVRDALAATPAPPGSICLELTESALMVDLDAAWTSLRLLKRLGVELALDDFGTGYSSLSYIRHFDLDVLKIDSSFVEGLGTSVEDTAIVEHVIGMASALGMTTIGEGVERPIQLTELHRLGCGLAQGYLLCEAVPAEAIDRLLADRTAVGPLAGDDGAQASPADGGPAVRTLRLVPFSEVDTLPSDRMVVVA